MYIDFSLILYIEFIFLDFRELFCSASFYNFYYFLRFRELNASSGSPSDLADDAESSSVPKLRLKVRNGSLLKVVAGASRCEAPTLIFCAVAFQHFILVLQSRPYLSSLFSRAVLSFSLAVLIFLGFLFFFSADISDTVILPSKKFTWVIGTLCRRLVVVLPSSQSAGDLENVTEKKNVKIVGTEI